MKIIVHKCMWELKCIVIHILHSIWYIIHVMHYRYCGISRTHCGSIFVVFMGSHRPRIYVIDENKFRKSYPFNWNWKPTHSRNYIPMNKQKMPTIQENWPPWIYKIPQYKIRFSTLLKLYHYFVFQEILFKLSIHIFLLE